MSPDRLLSSTPSWSYRLAMTVRAFRTESVGATLATDSHSSSTMMLSANS